MATTTTKLGMRKPAPSDAVDVTADISNNMDVLDVAVGTTVCTSSTRPSTPYTGQKIYETDTGFQYIWNGSWVFLTRCATVCTSGTRPTNTFNGLVIYETDTLESYIWNGSWVLYPRGVTLCTSSSRPATPTLGTLIYETDTFDLVVCVSVGPAVWVTLERAYVYGGKDVVHANTLTATGDNTTEVLINNMDSGSIDLIANTRYRVTVRWQAASSGALSSTYSTPTVFVVRVRDTNVSGTIRAEKRFIAQGTLTPIYDEMTFDYETTAAESGKVFVFSCARVTATAGPILTFQGGGTSRRLGMSLTNLGHNAQLTQVTT